MPGFPAMPSLPPTLSSRYRILRELGRGGMATVFLADDLKHRRQVAIKILNPQLSAAIGAERFLQEIEVTAGLQHPHILPLFDSGEADGVLFYVMQFVEGESLRDRLRREGKFPVADALAIAGDVAAALAAAHGRGVVHRDIKPENILLSGGEALVADFGIALALVRLDTQRLTATGLSVGTPAYMSPEQITGAANVDGRSDQYALACVLFEMLTGEPPFTGPTAQAIITQALVAVAPRARSRRSDVPPTTDAAIARALAKDPAERFDSATEFVDACAPPPAAAPAISTRRLATVGAGAIALLAAVSWPLWSSWQEARAHAALPTITAMAERGLIGEAYASAQRLEGRLTGDSGFAVLMAAISDVLTVSSDPPGASVYAERFSASEDARHDSVLLGITPLEAVRVPRIDHRVSVNLPGYRTVERMVSSALSRSEAVLDQGREISSPFVLLPDQVLPAGMAAVPGGAYTLVGPDLPIGLSVDLRPYYLDRFEVTNAQFREFVRDGGYATDRYWRPGISRTRFVDRTGLAGPRGWRNQEPPEGHDRHPVTGVSWEEARAYCSAQDKRLPTLFEWEKASRDGLTTHLGILMPWGYVTATTGMARRANFASSGTAPVDALPFGISPYGLHMIVGNVKEWLANPVAEGYAVAGGSWEDPAYVFSEVANLPETTATASLGFRCARNAVQGDPVPGSGALVLRRAPPVYHPVDASTRRSFLDFYRYDKRAANARIASTTDTADWSRERIWIDGIGTDSILAYLYLPTRTRPPYQAIVYVASSGAFFFQPVWRSVEEDLAPHVKAGRAVFAVVFDGMIERASPGGMQPPAPSSVGFRDLMVRHATELRMGVDYLQTRREIDSTRLAYYGFSWGAGSRLVFAGVDDRWRALVLVGAGIDERVQPTLPEAANYNFASHLRQPKLMVNGRQDEEHPWATRAKPLWDLLPQPKELLLIDGAGHHPPLEMRAQPINAFLDKVLGPVSLLPAGQK